MHKYCNGYIAMYFTLQYIRLNTEVCLKNALKKELYFRNFKCVSISEIHLNHEI